MTDNKLDGELAKFIRDYNNFVRDELVLTLQQFPASQRHLSVQQIWQLAMGAKIKIGRALRWRKREAKLRYAQQAIDDLFDLLELIDFAKNCGWLGLVSTRPNQALKNRLASDSESLRLDPERAAASEKRFLAITTKIGAALNNLQTIIAKLNA